MVSSPTCQPVAADWILTTLDNGKLIKLNSGKVAASLIPDQDPSMLLLQRYSFIISRAMTWPTMINFDELMRAL